MSVLLDLQVYIRTETVTPDVDVTPPMSPPLEVLVCAPNRFSRMPFVAFHSVLVPSVLPSLLDH